MARKNNQKPVPLEIQDVNSRLIREPGYLERAILLLFSRQAPDLEQPIGATILKNDIGFNKSNAKKGTELAQKILNEENWNSADRIRAREICFVHARQIHELMKQHPV